MSNTDSLQGALSMADLQAIWEGAVDQEYSRPLILAGEGGGFEVYTQAFAQAERFSEAIDYSTQQIFIQPWSGQSGEPASGPGYATVDLTFTRGGYLGRLLVIMAGQIVDEVQNDHSAAGSVPTNTGRQYVLQQNVVFFPGEQGPVTVSAKAAKPGYGYNNPLPGSISLLENAGTGLRNYLATLTLDPGAALPAPPVPGLGYTLTAQNVTDMFVPSNVGQYVLFTGGANRSQTALVGQYLSPDPSAQVGSAVELVPLVAWESFSVTHWTAIEVGAAVTFTAGGPTLGVGILLAAEVSDGGWKFAVLLQQGTTEGATTMLQQRPLVLAVVSMNVVFETGLLTPEAPSGFPLTGGSSWRILDWASDWMVTVSNAAQPTGGALGMLDLIGSERALPRQFNEPDEPYRDRLWQISDVVSPNAMKRALYQALGQLPWCYRETTNGLLPGVFYDRTNDPDGDFYDDDMILWSGFVVSGTFTIGDPIVYQRQVPVSTGPWLTMATGTYGGEHSPVMMFIRKSGQAFDPIAGDRIIDRRSGAIFTPTANEPDDFAVIRRWHVYLSYEDFRAYFAVEVPRVSYGEFGFAYDVHPLGAYDASPYNDFYDGFPAGSAPLYSRAWAELNAKRAGGVGFDLFLADGPCV